MIPRPTMVAFDIASDGRRDRVRELLALRGDWAQRSVWLLIPSSPDLPRTLRGELDEHLRSDDRLLIARPCLPCLGRVLTRPALTAAPVNTPVAAARSA